MAGLMQNSPASFNFADPDEKGPLR